MTLCFPIAGTAALLGIIGCTIAASGRTASAPEGRVIRVERSVKATLSDAWNAWTTSAGCRSFFAPDALIELERGGSYEIYFMPGAPAGTRGSEGCTVIEFEPLKHLAFTWNAPPHFPTLRSRHTRVDVMFESAGDDHVKVTLVQSEWKEGEEWDRLYEYFSRAWEHVLGNFVTRFEQGPIDWNAGK